MRFALLTGVVAACLFLAGGCTEGLSPDTTSAPLPGVEDPNAADPNANQPSGSEPTTGTPATNDTQGATDSPEAAPTEARDPTNTAVNKRDSRENPPPLPTDQGNSESDLAVVTTIRQKITSTDGLSFMARNVKVVVVDGKVTLRGPVASAAERETLDQIAREAAGDLLTVDNQLAIARER